MTDNKLRVNALTAVIDRAMHQTILHGQSNGIFAGGEFNKMWEQWQVSKGKLVDHWFYVLGFGIGMLNRLGFGDARIFPY